jgi:hypothetical protein
MAKFVVQRQPSDGVSTLGELLIDGQHYCWTLEPPDPILAGTYGLTITWSPRFTRLMPLVGPVPGHSGIRIHYGNWADNTDDCLLVGETQGKDFIGHSVDEFNILFRTIQDSLTQGETTISYVDPPAGGNVASGDGSV